MTGNRPLPRKKLPFSRKRTFVCSFKLPLSIKTVWLWSKHRCGVAQGESLIQAVFARRMFVDFSAVNKLKATDACIRVQAFQRIDR
jgi:hypothetical protein